MKNIFLFLLISSFTIAQTENWVITISEDDKSVYINSTGLNIYQTGDIFVWVKEDYNNPITMEQVDKKIYKVKSYYMINRELQKYSLIEVLYYDKENNVIKNYRYNRNFDNPQYKYSSPIIINSEMEKIFLKCEELIKQALNN